MTPVQLSPDDARLLRDAYRRERDTKIDMERCALGRRAAWLAAVQDKTALLEQLSDQHDFDPDERWTFDARAGTLIPAPPLQESA